jgi:hypothetical protein
MSVMRPIDPKEVRLAWEFLTNHLVKEIEAGEPEGRAALDTMEHAVGVLLGMFPEDDEA